MTNTEILEKLAVIMDRLDRIERKIDDINNKNTFVIPYKDTSVYPAPYYDLNKITCDLIKFD